MLFYIVLCFNFASTIEIDIFLHDIVNHFDFKEVEILSLNEDFELSSFVSGFWNENVKVSVFNEKQNSTHNCVFVLEKNEDNLKYVQYHYTQMWFMHESNLKYLDSWDLRLDSLIYLWIEVENEKVEIKVLKLN